MKSKFILAFSGRWSSLVLDATASEAQFTSNWISALNGLLLHMPSRSRRQMNRTITGNIMKKSWVASLLMGGLVLVTANSAFATATASTNVTTMSADNAATGGSGAYTTVTGPVLTEGSNHDITNGTIILTVSTNFQFNSRDRFRKCTRGSGTSKWSV